MKILEKPILAAALALPACLLATTPIGWNNKIGYKWTPTGDGPHYWDDSANWEDGAMPLFPTGAVFVAGGTVKIPSRTADNPFTEGSLFHPLVGSFPRGDKLVIDGSGTYWLKKIDSDATPPNPFYLNLVDYGGYFWGGEGHNVSQADDAAEFLATNVVLEIERAAADGEDGATLTLKQGFLNFYDPLGEGRTAHNHTLGIFQGNGANTTVIYEPGTHTRSRAANVRANGPNQVFWIKGGLHEFFQNFSGKNSNSRYPALTRISGGVFDVRTGWLMPCQSGAPDDSYDVIGRILVDGTGTLVHTNGDTTYVGWLPRSKSYLDLADDGFARLGWIRIGAQEGTYGEVNLSGNAHLEQLSAAYQIYIGKEKDTIGKFSMSGNATAALGEVRLGADDGNASRPHAWGEVNLTDNARLEVMNKILAGRSLNSTGIVTMAGHSFLTTDGTNIQLADGGEGGYAKMDIGGNAGLEHGSIYLANTAGTEADLIFSGSATNHVWNDNMGYTLYVGKTSNTVGRVTFKDSSTTTFGQIRVGGDDQNRTHDTAKGEMYVMDDASVDVNTHLYLARAYNSDGLLDISGGTLTFGPGSVLVCADGSNALARVNMTGGKLVMNNEIWFGAANYARTAFSMTGGELLSASNIRFNRNDYTSGDYYIGGDAKIVHTGDRVFLGDGNHTDTHLAIGGNADVYWKMWFTDTGRTDSHGELRVEDNATLSLRGEWIGLAPGSTNRLIVAVSATLNITNNNFNLGYAADPNSLTELILQDNGRLTGGHDSGSMVTLNIGNAASQTSRVLLKGGTSDAQKIDVNIQAAGTGHNLFEVSGGDHVFNHLWIQQTAGYETATNVARVTGGRVRFNDWTILGVQNLGRLEVSGGEFSTREINVGWGNQADDQVCVLHVSGDGVVTVEQGGNDAWLQIGNAAGSKSRGRIEQVGGEIRTHSIRANHSASGVSEAFFDGGKVVQSVKVHGSYGIIQGLNTAKVGATGLTIDSNGFAAYVSQAFTDALDSQGDPVEGRVTVTGNGSLDVRLNSTHSLTVVDGGTLTFSNGATVFGRRTILKNGGSVSLVGDATSQSFDNLTIGDATSAGVLKLDEGDTITITGADGLEVVNCVLDVSHVTGNGSYTVFRTGGLGTIDPAKLGNITIKNADPFKSYTLNADGTMTVADRVFAETEWLGTQSSLWSNNANWSANAPSGSDSKAIFGNVNNKNVQVSPDAAADVLEFTSPNYRVYGTDAVSVGVAIDNTSSGTVNIESPLALGDSLALMGTAGSETAIAGNISGTGVAVTKSGSGTVTLSGNNTGLNAAWTVAGGTLEFGENTSFGDADKVELESGTLAYTGTTECEVGGTLVVNTGTAKRGTIVDVDDSRSLVFSDIHGTSGSFVKKGAGTLKFDLGAGEFQFGDVSERWENPNTDIAFEASGDSPASTDMFNNFSVVEGRMVIEGDGSNVTKVVHRNGLAVGERYAGKVAESELVLKNVYFDNFVDAYFSIGRVAKSTTFNEPNVQVIDGTYLYANKLVVGWGSAVQTTSTLAVTNSVVYCNDHIRLAENDSSIARLRVGPGGKIRARNNIDIRGGLDVLVEGEGAELTAENNNGHDDRWTWDGILRFEDWRGRGTMAFKNGGTLSLASRIHCFNKYTDGSATRPGVQLVFDGGTLKLGSNGTSIMWKPQYQGVRTEGAGMTLSVAEGAVSTWTIPIRGEGGFVKTGAGELHFAGVKDCTDYRNVNNFFEFDFDDTDMLNGWYEGATEVREGILTLAAGSITNTTAVTVGEAGALNLGGNAFSFPSVEGSGVISNGTLRAVVKVSMDKSTRTGAMPTFSDVTLPDDLLLDFEFDGKPETRVPYTLAATGCDAVEMTGWRATCNGQKYRPVFTVDGSGRAVVTLHKIPFTIIIR